MLLFTRGLGICCQVVRQRLNFVNSSRNLISGLPCRMYGGFSWFEVVH
ncbi:hypothetical protein ROSINTL182_07872 [Roseburia intestinalis L1-82]|uniref:Uncharacterized protein n=1 Tax=Roseburia intestinalis L1-82 TaxID=536231 RepID=C7GD71_9FIRM|nr:hypothetical protein ROSINTL182_07872 [Roseburia intestinalis L1-82]